MCSLSHLQNRWYKHFDLNDHKGNPLDFSQLEMRWKKSSLEYSQVFVFVVKVCFKFFLDYLKLCFCCLELEWIFLFITLAAHYTQSLLLCNRSVPVLVQYSLFIVSILSFLNSVLYRDPVASTERPLMGLVLKSSDLGHDSLVQSGCSTCWFDCHFQFSHDPVVLEWGISGRK